MCGRKSVCIDVCPTKGEKQRRMPFHCSVRKPVEDEQGTPFRLAESAKVMSEMGAIHKARSRKSIVEEASKLREKQS